MHALNEPDLDTDLRIPTAAHKQKHRIHFVGVPDEGIWCMKTSREKKKSSPKAKQKQRHEKDAAKLKHCQVKIDQQTKSDSWVTTKTHSTEEMMTVLRPTNQGLDRRHNTWRVMVDF